MKRNVITKIIFGIWFSLCSPMFAFESEFLSVKAEGNGSDLILIHGFASSPEVWSGLVDKIGSEYRLHSVTITGFAGSKSPTKQPESYLNTLRDEIARYIEQEKLDSPTLMGHSMGGLLSLLTASRETPRVGKVIVVDALPFYSLLFNPMATKEMVLPQAEAMEMQLLALAEEQFEQQVRASTAILTKQDDKKELLLKWSKSSDRKIYASYLKEVMSYDARPDLRGISCPVIVIHAYDEAMRVPQERLHQLYTTAYSKLKRVSIETIPGSFHFIMWDQPEHFILTAKEALEVSLDKAPEI